MRGKDGKSKTAWSLRAVHDIMTESFDPVLDLATGEDLLPHMVRSAVVGDWDYTGIFSLLLRHKVCTP